MIYDEQDRRKCIASDRQCKCTTFILIHHTYDPIRSNQRRLRCSKFGCFLLESCSDGGSECSLSSLAAIESVNHAGHFQRESIPYPNVRNRTGRRRGRLTMNAVSKQYFTPEELVERYKSQVTVRTLANWRSAGTSPPFTKIGGRILYPVKELLEWEQRRTVQSTSMYGRMALLLALIPAPLYDLVELAI